MGLINKNKTVHLMSEHGVVIQRARRVGHAQLKEIVERAILREMQELKESKYSAILKASTYYFEEDKQKIEQSYDKWN